MVRESQESLKSGMNGDTCESGYGLYTRMCLENLEISMKSQ